MKINKAKSRILMFAGALPKLVRIFMAVGVLSVVSNVAEAVVFSTSPNMFASNYTAHLHDLNNGLVPLHGVGPGGMTLYAQDIYVKDFVFEGFNVDAGNGIETYSATLTAQLLFADGSSAGGSMTLSSNSLFKVQFDGRTDQTTSGSFTAHLLAATFNGFTVPGDPLKIYLLNTPSALSTINAVDGGYDLSPPIFPLVSARSEISDIIVGDMDMVDEPEIALLLLPALLLVGAKRRRLAVLAG